MDMFSNTKTIKKFILILIFITCFSFCCPKNVNAGLVDDIVAAPAKIFWLVEEGVLTFLNNIFTNPDNAARVQKQVSNGAVTSKLLIKLTPDNIIKGKFILFDADIFNEINNDAGYFDYVEGGAVADGKIALRETVSGWYYALRNFSIVALLSVLVYVGIRMIISTMAQDKAKYKTMFKDWLVALCLVIVMHYMMIGILNITSMITEALGGGESVNMVGNLSQDITGILSDPDDDNPYTYNGMTLSDAYAKIIVLGGIIVYTFIFAVKYLKREFTVIFLVLLGPISCITYPIDKISDGKAQAFNKWLSEFMSQVLIQPFHLLLYIVLIGSAADLADANVIYALICFAVMTPAEQFVKQMFGIKDSAGGGSGFKAFGAGALAGNMAKSLMNGKGGSGGGKPGIGPGGNDGKEGSGGNELPPKTVNRDNLNEGSNGSDSSSRINQNNNPQLESGVDSGESSRASSSGGSGNSSENQSIDQRDNPQLESGGDSDGTAGGASVAAAYQDSDDPRGDAEREALEEKLSDGQMDESELTDEQRELLGKNNNDEAEEQEGSPNTKDDPSDSEEGSSDTKDGSADSEKGEQGNEEGKTGFKDRIKSAASKVKNSKAMKVHQQRAAKKYGVDKKQRWKARTKKGLKISGKVLKAAAKGTAIGVLGGISITSALATGNGKEALGMAIGIGTYAGKQALSGGKKAIKGAAGAVKGATKDYANAFRKDEGESKWYQLDTKEEKARKSFKSDPAQVEKAIASYKQNHEGKEPGIEEINQEMDDRFDLSRYGLKDDQIDKAVGSYQELKEGGTPKEDALNQTAFASKLAEDYSKKDFRSEKTMGEAVKSISKDFQDRGVPKEIADRNAEKYLQRAAKIKGVDIALPSRNQTVDVPVNAPAGNRQVTIPAALGVDESSMSPRQIERMNNITMRLREQGYTEPEIISIASSANESGMNSTQLINKFAVKTEFLENKGQQAHAVKMLEASGKEVTPENIRAEMQDRLVLSETFNVRPQDVSHIRKEEVKRIPQSQTEVARDFAIRNKGKLNNEAHMEKEKQNLINQLKVGGSSEGGAVKDAENIIALAGQIEGIQNQTSNKGKSNNKNNSGRNKK